MSHKSTGKLKNQIAVGQFKAHCLQLITDVNRRRTSLIITKHGKPLVKLVPYDNEPTSLFGCLKDSITINQDIVGGTGEKWNADE